MDVIYKYPIEITDLQGIELPEGYQILKVAEQDGGLFVWVKVDTDAKLIKRPFVVVGTGHELDMYGFLHLDSVVMSNGLVWHVFIGVHYIHD